MIKIASTKGVETMNEKVQDIIQKMTLEEKAALCSGKDFWHITGVPRLGVEPAMVSDGPHGLRKQDETADHLGVNESIKAVCFPAGCATACSFDQDLMYKMGKALGQECRAENVSVLLGPAMNIKRSPLCGRNFEYYSEDPYLAGKIASSFIQGVQSQGVGTSPKHFAANNQEYRRMSSSSNMSERTLREIYLAGFETAVKEAAPWTMMCSYNRINGVYASENTKLLTDILRKEWGFEGFVMSDWGAVNEKIEAIKAGLELEMPGPCEDSVRQVVEAVKSGALSEETLNEAVRRILEILLKEKADASNAVFDREADHHLAAEIEAECAVLMKNNGLLPLSKEQNIVYMGGFAKKPRYQGGGSSHINATRVIGAAEMAGAHTTYVKGFDVEQDELVESEIAQAVNAAKAADTAVIFAGLPDSFECEGYDRSHMRLPKCQDELIARVANVQPNTVVVLHVGSPVEMPWVNDVAAVLCMYLGGEGVGEATHALLYGEKNPCGRLAESWPLALEHNPSFLNFPGNEDGVHYAEGVFVGYRYYDKKKLPVQFAFGAGESYTTFSYQNPVVEVKEGVITAKVEVTNTGSRFGKEVVQLYVADKTGTENRPERELKGFAKLALLPGETKCAEFTLTQRDLSFYSEALRDWFAPGGEYEICFAHSSRDIRQVKIFAFETNQQLPLTLHRNTTVGALLKHPKTAAVLQPILPEQKEEGGEASKEAITAEMIRQMFINSPLRTLRGYLNYSKEQMDDLMAKLEQALKQ